MANAIAYDWDIDLALSADHVDPEIELEESFWALHLEPEDPRARRRPGRGRGRLGTSGNADREHGGDVPGDARPRGARVG